MSMNLSQIQTQKQVLAPLMQQSVELLLLPLLDLETEITQELQNNPLLEIDEQKTFDKHREVDAIVERSILHFKKTPTEYSFEHAGDPHEEEPDEKPYARPPSLEEHLLRQLHIEVEDPELLRIGEWIIGSLDQDGYLPHSVQEMADLLQCEDVQIIEKVLGVIRRFDPPGIASRDLKECLLAQIEYRSFEGVMGLTKRLITHHLDNLGRKKHLEIARELRIPVEQVKALAKEISSLEPRPARGFSVPLPSIYVKPDVLIRRTKEDQYEIVINNEQLPVLRVNASYQNMLKNPALKDGEKEFIREKIKNAVFFIKSIEQRHQTIKAIVEYIVQYQKEFWEEGYSALKPMGLKDVAEAVGRNESTVSRAISNKYADTPQGIFPLKYFFSQAVNETEENTVTNRSIQEEIRGIVAEENKKKPLSDQDLQDILKKRQMDVARRTIAKYRKTLHILPAYLRKE